MPDRPTGSMQSPNAAWIVPWRFVCMTFHLVAVLCALYRVPHNAEAALTPLGTDADRQYVAGCLLTAHLLSLACLLGCYGGFLSGVSMFNEPCSVVQSLFHFVGGMMLCFFAADDWYYSSAWILMGVCAGGPLCLEVANGVHVAWSPAVKFS
eukprot:GGOE01046393.1.p2 GENE.GGOE01046393.1~~GGOE01046393.1.p2  ORF type:complete len:169 (+),score=38.68 GGOE01046393.1:52-507(+)